MNKKIVIAVILIVIVAAAGVFVWQAYFRAPEIVFCIQDAKLCPDGSYVSRVAPKCEFKQCPGK